jgi:alpha-tubulin suppressor-like RCC1 family protein
MGFESTYAVTEGGTIYAWGFNGRGQLGIDSRDDVVAVPTQVMTAPGVPLQGGLQVLRSDGSDQCAEVSDAGAVSRYVCWGADDDGELGFGAAHANSQYAKAVSVLDASARGLVRGENHACAVVTRENATDIVCYGKALYVANGSLDPNADQVVPAGVDWDPASFSHLLQ